jgi:hypothetical protein
MSVDKHFTMVVAWLRKHGFKVRSAEMVLARRPGMVPHPNISIAVDPDAMVDEIVRLLALVRGAGISVGPTSPKKHVQISGEYSANEDRAHLDIRYLTDGVYFSKHRVS